MENEKVNLLIESHEEKVKKAGGNYTRFKTSDGWMSCFESEVSKKLKELEGQTVCVEISTTEKDDGTVFKNIKSIRTGEVVVEKVGEVPQETKVSPTNRNTTMYVSYAKDLCAVMMQIDSQEPKQIRKPLMVMTEAIALVKQAQKAFS